MIVSGEPDVGHGIRVLFGERVGRRNEGWKYILGLGKGHKGPHVVGTDQTRTSKFQSGEGAGNYLKNHKTKMVRLSFNHLPRTPRTSRFPDLLCPESTKIASQINLLKSQTANYK